MPIPLLGMLGAAAVSGGMGMLGADQQNKTNRSNMEWSEEAQNRLADKQFDRQMAMWAKTGPVGMGKELEKAGMNKALMYGGSGTGGQTAAAGAPSAPQGSGAANPNLQDSVGMAMQMANLKLMDAQAKKAEAEAEKIAGIDTREGTARAASTEFDNALKGVLRETMERRARAEGDLAERHNQKDMAEYNAWQAANFKGEPTDNENSPLRKAYTAGLEKAITEAENAKKDGNIKDATRVIEEFKANLAKSGLAPDSPWYVKLIAEIGDRMGINPMTK